GRRRSPAQHLSACTGVFYFENSKNMLSLLIGDDIYDAAKCKAAVEEYSLLNHVKGCKVPQFLCYGSRETLSGMPEYGQKMKMEREDNQVVVVSGAGHGFGTDEHRKHSPYWPEKFADWINRVCPNG
ncbi:MAG: hypothetical protein LUH07_03600, partial [Lachnospiraceae bacterium]|nr:hypothetical protein [Lachnospiraceae bacterium]